jgi:hypothetical protein
MWCLITASSFVWVILPIPVTLKCFHGSLHLEAADLRFNSKVCKPVNIWPFFSSEGQVGIRDVGNYWRKLKEYSRYWAICTLNWNILSFHPVWLQRRLFVIHNHMFWDNSAKNCPSIPHRTYNSKWLHKEPPFQKIATMDTLILHDNIKLQLPSQQSAVICSSDKIHRGVSNVSSPLWFLATLSIKLMLTSPSLHLLHKRYRICMHAKSMAKLIADET